MKRTLSIALAVLMVLSCFATMLSVVASAEETEAEIVDAAFALEVGKSLSGSKTLTGVVSSIVTEYSTEYQNVTVDMTVKNTAGEDKTMRCYRMKGDDAATVEVGDTIKVTGTIKNFKGTVEFDTGCTFETVKKVSGDYAIKTFAGYASGDVAILVRQEGKTTITDLTGKDYNAYALIICNGEGKVTALDLRGPGRPAGVKGDVEVPDGGFIIGINRDVAGYPLSVVSEAFVANGIEVGSRIKLFGVDLAALATTAAGTALTDASFSVLPRLPETQQEILDAAFALPAGERLEGTYSLTGVVTKKNDTNTQVNFMVGGKDILCYKVNADDYKKFAVGDTITVNGILKNYNGTVEFDSGCTASVVTSYPASLWNNFDATTSTYVDGINQGKFQGADSDCGNAFSYVYAADLSNVYFAIATNYAGIGTATSYGNGTGTNLRLWFRTNDEATVYTHFVDVSYDGDATPTIGAKKCGDLHANKNAAAIATDGIVAEAVASENGLFMQVKIPFSVIEATKKFGAFVTVSNGKSGDIVNNCIIHPVGAAGQFSKDETTLDLTKNNTYFPYTSWNNAALAIDVPPAIDGEFTDDIWKDVKWIEVNKDNARWQSVTEAKGEVFNYKFAVTDDGEYLYVGAESEAAGQTQFRFWINNGSGSVYTSFVDLFVANTNHAAKYNTSVVRNVGAVLENSSLIAAVKAGETKTGYEFMIKLSDLGIDLAKGFGYFTALTASTAESGKTDGVYYPAPAGTTTENMPYRTNGWDFDNEGLYKKEATPIGAGAYKVATFSGYVADKPDIAVFARLESGEKTLNEIANKMYNRTSTVYNMYKAFVVGADGKVVAVNPVTDSGKSEPSLKGDLEIPEGGYAIGVRDVEGQDAGLLAAVDAMKVGDEVKLYGADIAKLAKIDKQDGYIDHISFDIVLKEKIFDLGEVKNVNEISFTPANATGLKNVKISLSLDGVDYYDMNNNGVIAAASGKYAPSMKTRGVFKAQYIKVTGEPNVNGTIEIVEGAADKAVDPKGPYTIGFNEKGYGSALITSGTVDTNQGKDAGLNIAGAQLVIGQKVANGVYKMLVSSVNAWPSGGHSDITSAIEGITIADGVITLGEGQVALVIMSSGAYTTAGDEVTSPAKHIARGLANNGFFRVDGEQYTFHSVQPEAVPEVLAPTIDGALDEEIWKNAEFKKIDGQTAGTWQSKVSDYTFEYAIVEKDGYAYFGVKSSKADMTQLRVWFHTNPEAKLYTHFFDVYTEEGKAGGLKTNQSLTENKGSAYDATKLEAAFDADKKVFEAKVKLEDVGATTLGADDVNVQLSDGNALHSRDFLVGNFTIDGAMKNSAYMPWIGWFDGEIPTYAGLIPKTNHWTLTPIGTDYVNYYYVDDSLYVIDEAQWPYMTYVYPAGDEQTYEIEGNELHYNFSVTGGTASIRLIFKTDDGTVQYMMTNTALGLTEGQYIPSNGDFKAVNCIGVMSLQDLVDSKQLYQNSDFPAAAIKDGKITFAGIEIFAIGGATVVINELAVEPTPDLEPDNYLWFNNNASISITIPNTEFKPGTLTIKTLVYFSEDCEGTGSAYLNCYPYNGNDLLTWVDYASTNVHELGKWHEIVLENYNPAKDGVEPDRLIFSAGFWNKTGTIKVAYIKVYQEEKELLSLTFENGYDLTGANGMTAENEETVWGVVGAAKEESDEIELLVSHLNLYNWNTFDIMLTTKNVKEVPNVSAGLDASSYVMYKVEAVKGQYVVKEFVNDATMNDAVPAEGGFLLFANKSNRSYAAIANGELVGKELVLVDFDLKTAFAIDTQVKPEAAETIIARDYAPMEAGVPVSRDKTYTYPENTRTDKWAENGTKLTDGAMTADGGSDGYSGWGAEVEIVVDLGYDYKVDLFDVEAAANGGWGIKMPTGFTVSYSLDGENYTAIEAASVKGDEIATGNWVSALYTIELDKPVKARYVKFTMIKDGGFNWIDEVEVWAADNHAIPVDLSDVQPDELEDLPADAIVIDYAGYKHAGVVSIVAGNNQTIAELTARGNDGAAKDMNYAFNILVNADDEVIDVDYELGKACTFTCPEGGYIISYNGNKAGYDVMKNIKVGAVITVYNVNIDAVREIEGNVELTKAGFTYENHEYEEVPEGAYVITHAQDWDADLTIIYTRLATGEKTLGEVTAVTTGKAQDCTWWNAIVVDGEGKITKVIGMVDKKDEEIPEGGFIIAAHGSSPVLNTLPTFAEGSKVTLYNCDLEAFSKLDEGIKLRHAAFTVTEVEDPNIKRPISYQKSYTVTGNTRTDNFKDDGVKLTDGKIVANGGTAGSAGLPVADGPSVTVDLGDTYRVDKFTVHAFGGQWGITIITGFTVAISTDGENFTELTDASVAGEAEGDWQTTTFTIALDEPVEARYVKFVSIGGNYLWADEVEVWETEKEAGPVYKLGDLNGDDEVDAIDYLLLKKSILGSYTLSPEEEARADVNGDGEIDARDYIYLKKLVLAQ